MAVTATARVLYDGPRHCIMQFTGTGDGAGDETNVRKVDCAELNPPCRSVAIQKITYDVGFGVVELLWEDAMGQHAPFHELSEAGAPFEYDKINGLTNKGPDTATGNILFSTKGFELNSTYSIVLEMRKKNKL